MLDLFNVLENADNFCVNMGLGEGIPAPIASIVHIVYLGIKIIVPVMLIIFGMIDLAKSISSQKEDEIKKAQAGLLKKAVVAVIVFLVFSLVQFVIGIVAPKDEGDNQNIWNCVSDLMNGSRSAVKTDVTGGN